MEAIGSTDTNDAFFWESPTISLGETPDPLQMESDVKKPLAERAVMQLTEEKTVHYKLDNCVNVQSYTDLYRQKMAEAWQGAVELYTTLRTVVCVVAAAALAVPSLRIVAACVGVASLIFSTYRIAKANEQIQLWNTPPYQKPAEQRAKAYLEPAFYAHCQQNVLHPNEEEYLYKKYLDNFCEKLLQENPSTDQEKQEWLAKFFTLNPLSPDMMQKGWGNIPAAFEEINKEYTRLSSESITPSMLCSKFEAPVFVFGPIIQMGVFHATSYLNKPENPVVECENQLENLKNEYLHKKNNLKFNYGKRLEEIASNDVQNLNDQFEYDLKVLKDTYIAQAEHLKNLFSLQVLDSQEPHDLEGNLEKSWNELQAIYRENNNLAFRDGQYEEARNLLEHAKKELNPPPIITIEPIEITPEEPCEDVPDVVNCPFS